MKVPSWHAAPDPLIWRWCRVRGSSTPKLLLDSACKQGPLNEERQNKQFKEALRLSFKPHGPAVDCWETAAANRGGICEEEGATAEQRLQTGSGLSGQLSNTCGLSKQDCNYESKLCLPVGRAWAEMLLPGYQSFELHMRTSLESPLDLQDSILFGVTSGMILMSLIFSFARGYDINDFFRCIKNFFFKLRGFPKGPL